VAKMKDLGASLEEVAIILDDIPVAQYHAGSRLKFDAEGKLLISMEMVCKRKKHKIWEVIWVNY
jgi:glucose/arabinose dehydrogenase